jgi:hypothetical protein
LAADPAPARSGGPEDRVRDLSLEPAGVASVVAVRVRCEHALRVVARWQQGRTTGEFTCVRTPHSFDQIGVECVKHPARRCRNRADKWIAFVFRDPAASTTPNRLGSAVAPPTGPVEPEELDADDELPRGEES